MSIVVWNGSAWVDVKGVFSWTGSAWARRRAKRWNGSAWVDANVETVQYGATASRTYWGNSPSIEIEKQYENHYYDLYDDHWYTDTALRQGRYALNVVDEVYTGNAFGTFCFGSGIGKPTELSTKTLISARLFLKRYNESGAESPLSVKIFTSTLTSVPSSGASSPSGNVTGTEQVLGTLDRNEAKWFTLPNDMADNVIDGKCLALYYGSSNYQKLYGVENASYKPVIEFTYY